MNAVFCFLTVRYNCPPNLGERKLQYECVFIHFTKPNPSTGRQVFCYCTHSFQNQGSCLRHLKLPNPLHRHSSRARAGTHCLYTVAYARIRFLNSDFPSTYLKKLADVDYYYYTGVGAAAWREPNKTMDAQQMNGCCGRSLLLFLRGKTGCCCASLAKKDNNTHLLFWHRFSFILCLYRLVSHVWTNS